MTLTQHNNKIINELADYLYANPTQKMSDIVSLFVTKCHKNKRTIWRWILLAKEYNQTRLTAQQNAVNKVLNTAAVQKISADILNREQILSELTKIVRQSKSGEAIRAMDLIAKIEGYYAAVQHDLTSGGAPIVEEKPLSADEIRKLQHELENM